MSTHFKVCYVLSALRVVLCATCVVQHTSQLGLHLGLTQLKEPWGASTGMHPHHHHQLNMLTF